MDPLFHPQSVAVVGVSTSADNLGKNIVKNLLNFGYEGKIYPVGPRPGRVEGLPIFSSVAELPEKPDVAVILTPARFVPDIVSQCGERGVRWAVIQTGGFRESGPDGMALERRLLESADRYGLRFVGPNCLGVMNTFTGFSVPFITLPSTYRKGPVAVMAQSGGMGLSLVERLSTSGVGFGKFVSLGNKLVLDEVDYLSYLIEDPQTEILYFYLEDFKRGRDFFRLAAKSPKPIILHKSNTSPISRTIAQSHTAALAADDRLVDQLARAAGVVRVRSVSQAVQAAKAFSMPRLRGNNLAVLSRSGGHAVVAADTCGEFGFRFPPLCQEVLEEIQRHARAGVIRPGNPLDLGDIYDLNVYFGIAEKVLKQPDIDGVVHVHVSHMPVEKDATRKLLAKLERLAGEYRKPVSVVVEVPFEDRTAVEKEASYPFFLDVREAVEALAMHRRVPSQPGGGPEALLKEGAAPPWYDAAATWIEAQRPLQRQPMVHEGLELLRILDIPTASWALTRSVDDARDAAASFGYPVVLKAVGKSLVHKSDLGGVAVGIEDEGALVEAWRRLASLCDDLEGVLVQKMVKGMRELIVGAHRDPVFGAVVLVGQGGILVELLQDVNMRLAPVDEALALEMIQELRCSPVLGPYRGFRAADIASAGDALAKISLLIHCFDVIREVDINPILLGDRGEQGVAVDARVLLEMPNHEDPLV
ncbi:MAG: acetate--CoA ligase family protein [Desulfosoma sp.]